MVSKFGLAALLLLVGMTEGQEDHGGRAAMYSSAAGKMRYVSVPSTRPRASFLEQTHALYSCLITLSKPGEGCDLHPAYPNTIQCAETRRCIAFSQYKDGRCDCCGPDVDCATCYDHSDESSRSLLHPAAPSVPHAPFQIVSIHPETKNTVRTIPISSSGSPFSAPRNRISVCLA